MSESRPGASWQRPELASGFLSERQTVLPLVDVQEEVIRELLARHRHPATRVLDLGAGDGAMTRLALSVNAPAQAVLVDFSEPMLQSAAERLAGAPARWELVRADLSDPSWVAELPGGPFGLAVSGLAIHHLPAQRKRALFAEVFALLEPGAMFVNMDYVSVDGPLRGLWDERMLENALRAERERGGGRSQHQVEHELFDDSEDDRPDDVWDQLQWLREAGFERAEVHFKWAEGAVFGAIKPGADDGRAAAAGG